MSEQKRFIPCIFLKNQTAVKGFLDDALLSGDPEALARRYAENGADEIIVYDLSTDDATHEAALDIIREICGAVPIPVIGAGNVHRMEDVKKLLYAGCARASLNYSKTENVEITKEVSQKFGRDKILACIRDASEIAENEEALKTYVDEIILINEHTIKQAMAISPLPVVVTLPDVSLDKIIEILRSERISGLTGVAINENYREIEKIKQLCTENGIAVRTLAPAVPWDSLKKNSDGLVPVIVQDYRTNEVLMQAYMNEEAYLQTVKTGRMTYFSRSRQELWLKGETSGHFQYVKALYADCDLDTILAKVKQIGVACHTGAYSCFFNEILKTQAEETETENPLAVFERVMNVIKDRQLHPKEGSYTNYLFDKGLDKILKKLGEEATEIVIAAKNPNGNEVKYEIADFLYHLMVLMAQQGISWEEITEELSRR